MNFEENQFLLNPKHCKIKCENIEYTYIIVLKNKDEGIV